VKTLRESTSVAAKFSSRKGPKVSVAGLLLTTEAVVAEKPDEKKAMSPAPHPDDL
jgi:hypothetical protein